MATTSIWKVEGWLGKVLIYAENPEKTDNPAYYQSEKLSQEEKQGLTDVIQYAMREEATSSMADKERFVSGVNCSPNTAREEMLAVKKRYGKNEGIVAFHGYQSFAPNEVTPEVAHEIGVKLANELWGDRFQVIVATHLDKQNHLHNHFVLNSVSYIDGYRYSDCRATYKLMRDTSDRLCKEYQLSVIENPAKNKSKHYAEWRAENEGVLTWRGIIKNDLDEAIVSSVTDKQFFHKLREKGYYIKQGKDITVRPQGKQRGMKIARNFGEDYTYEAICQRIMQNPIPAQRKPTITKRTVTVLRLHGDLSKQRKIGGLRGRYLYYCYKLGIFPKNKPISDARIHFLLKEDIRRMHELSQEAKLLCTNKIDTTEQLFSYQSKKKEEMQQHIQTRKHLRYRLRRKTLSDEDKQGLKYEIAELSKQIDILRKEVILCDDIAERSQVIKDKLDIIQQDETENRKEEKANERKFRRS